MNTLLKWASFLFVLIAVGVAIKSPATSYESSIYTSTPLIVWICLGIAYLLGFILLLNGIKDNRWRFGYLVLVVCNLALLSLFILRGYDYWGVSGDVGTHLGWIQDLVRGDGLIKGNFYPLTHLLVAGLSIVSQIEPATIIKFIPLIFSVVYYLGIYLCAKEIAPEKTVPFIVLLGIPFLDGYFLVTVPSVLANLSFPLMLWFYLRSYKQKNFKWVAPGLFIAYPLFHFVAWIAMAVAVFVISTIAKRYGDVYILLAMGLMGLFWLSFTNSPDTILKFITPFHLNFDMIIGIIKGMGEVIGKGADVGGMFLKTYGGILAYGVLALWGWLKLKRHNHTLLKSFCFTCGAFILLIVYLHFTQLWFDPMRFYFFVTVLILFPAGYGLSVIWERLHRVRYAIIVIVAMILANSVMMVYASPYSLQPSLHVTQNEVDGMKWLMVNKDTKLYSGGWYYDPQCFAAFLLTKEERTERRDLTKEMYVSVPYHLGYDNHESIGELNGEDWYLVINEKMRAVYKDTYHWLEQDRLIDGDFAKLGNDPNARLLYSKGGFEVYYITRAKK